MKMCWSMFLFTTDTLSIAVDTPQFNDKPVGGGDRAAQHSTPKMPLHRSHLVELLGSFLPRMSKHRSPPGLSLN